MLDMNVDRAINAIGMLLIGAVILVVGFDLFGRDSSFLVQMVGGSEGYVVEYELNGGDGEFNRSVIDYEETHFTIVHREPTRSSYVFTGWEVEGEAGEVYFPGSILPIDDNIKLVAQWQEGTHNVKYDLNGGTGNLPDDRAKFNELYQIKTTVPTKTGYHLTGWKSSSDSGEYASGHELYITEATTLTAQWGINDYTIQYDLNGGTGVADYPSTNVQHGRNFTISNVTPKREGYDFNGWLSESSGQKYGVGDNFTANASTKLVAQWAVENKRINFDLNGGSYSGVNNAPALTQYAGFEELFTTPDQLPIKSGYVFNGWINNHDNLTYQAGTTFRVKNDTRLTAQWSLDKYAVTYDLDGGSGSFAGTTVNHNTEYTVRTGTPVKNGYTFNGWISSLDNHLYRGNDKFAVYNNTVLKADWKINRYTVNFDLNGGSGTFNPDTANFNDEYRISTRAPVKDGDAFVGWRNSADNRIYKAGDKFVIAGPTTLTAQWSTKSYTVSYNTNGGSGNFSNTTHLYGAYATVNNTKPTRTGYTFLSWLNKSDGKHYGSGERFLIQENTELEAQWDVNTYHMDYNLNGGSGSFPREEVDYGVDHRIQADVPTRTGYTFKGWKLGNETTLIEPASTVTPTGNITLTAQWEIDSHTVTYNLDGGKGVAHFTTTHARDNNVKHKIPTEKPTKKGHNFIRWSNSLDGKTYNPGESFTVTDDVILTAEWEPGIFDITFNLGGGTVKDNSGFAKKQIPYGDDFMIDSQVPQKSGVDFVGWIDTNTRNLYQPGELFIVEEATHFEAYWGHNDYSLKYDANGGTITYSDTVIPSGENDGIGWAEIINGEQHTVIAGPTLTDYRFDGWEDTSTGTVYQTGAKISVRTDTTLQATYVINKRTVSFNLDGGSGSFPSQEVVTDSSHKLSTTKPTRTGYTFAGWKRSDTNAIVQAGGSFTMPYENITLTATWTINSYKVTYDTKGGSGSFSSSTHKYGTNHKVSSTKPTLTGYTFDGWKRSDNGAIVQAGESFSVPSQNVTLTAQWTINSYNVTYDRNGGTSGPSGTTKHNYATTFSINSTKPTRTGYTFDGWKRSDNGAIVQAGGNFSVPAQNVTLTAQWSVNGYDVKYDRNGGTSGPSGTTKHNYGTTFSINSTKPTRTGYTFDGWKRSDTGAIVQPGGTFSVPSQNVTLTAQWTINSYDVKYDRNGGTSGPSGTTKHNYGTTFSINSTKPTRTGYTFDGWKRSDNGAIVQAGGSFTIPNQNVTLTAQWSVNGYDVKYDRNGGTSGPSGTTKHNYGTTFSINSTKPTRTGYTFDGWERSDTGAIVQAGGSFTIPNQNVTLTAQWTTNSYKVTYNTNGGSGSFSSSTHKYGTNHKVSSTKPTRTGYTFTGWKRSDNSAIVQAGGSFTMPNQNITLTAQWDPMSIRVEYVFTSGMTNQSSFSEYVTVDYGTELTLPTTKPLATGKTFLRWSAVKVGARYNPGERILIDDSIVDFTNMTVRIASAWTYNEYSVTYDLNGGSGSFSQGTHNYGENHKVSSTKPTLTGYTFDGWKRSDNGAIVQAGGNFSVPAQNVKLTAQWTTDSYKVTYDLKGGSGTFPTATHDYGTNHTVSLTKPTRTHFTLLSWTKRGSGGGYISPGSSFKVTSDTTLSANWSRNTSTVSYNANGGSGAPRSQTKRHGIDLTLSGTKPTRAGYTFLGWNTNSSGTGTNYPSGGGYTENSDVTLYARWSRNNYKVTYDMNDGTGGPPNTEVYGQSHTINKSSIPSREGHVFAGWDYGGSRYNPNSTITMPQNDITLTAKWLPDSHIKVDAIIRLRSGSRYAYVGASGVIPDTYTIEQDLYITGLDANIVEFGALKEKGQGRVFTGITDKANIILQQPGVTYR